MVAQEFKIDSVISAKNPAKTGREFFLKMSGVGFTGKRPQVCLFESHIRAKAPRFGNIRLIFGPETVLTFSVVTHG